MSAEFLPPDGTAATPRHAPLIRSLRGDVPELVHYGSIAVVDRDGGLVVAVGDVDAPQYPRSALKPFQALPLVEDGVLARFGFGSQELAMACASHSGEKMHVRLVSRMLDAIDAGVDRLQCGCHVPSFYAATHRTPPERPWTPLSHNCSGKHTGFLSLTRFLGAPLERYLDPDGPAQTRVRTAIARALSRDALPAGIDGCSAPTYAVPLRSLAHAFARLAGADDPALQSIFFAMTRHPELVAGTARGDLALMRAGRGDWVAKVGADGTQAMGLRTAGLGIAIRVADGQQKALLATTRMLLGQLGLLDADADMRLTAVTDEFKLPTLRNARGIEVGHYEPAFAALTRR